MNKTSFLDYNATATVDPNMKVPLNPAPEKMARAIAFLEEHGLPPELEKPKKSKKHTRSTLQNELLNIYTFEPTEEEMLQLKAFLAQLFADKMKESKAHQEAAMTA